MSDMWTDNHMNSYSSFDEERRERKEKEQESKKIELSRPEVSAHDFMKYLCASLIKQGKAIVSSEGIERKVYEYKQSLDSQYQYLFDDIEFRKSIDNVVSEDIATALVSLKTFGVIERANNKLMIWLTQEEADKVLENCKDASVFEGLAEKLN
jgi:hypothetical protein